MKTTKIIIVESKLGKFAFTKDENNNLIYQEFGKTNQIYFTTDPNEGGNLSDDWDMVDYISSLDNEYKNMVEKAIEQLKEVKND
tara:strand:+ start:248 stop:499 length:252 start_codon:yes stop_codon:yes gene_type:complete